MAAESHGYSTNDILSIMIEVTTFCNMGCACCIRTVKNDNSLWFNKHLRMDNFMRILETLPPADEIITQGVGEPTMNPDLPGIIEAARRSEKFQRICFTTNGMVRKLDYYTNLFNIGLSKLYVSIDSLDPVLAEHLRAGTKVNTLKKIVHELSERHPGKIAIRTVVGSENISTIPALLKNLNRLGKLEVFMHPYDDIGNPAGCLSRGEQAKFHDQIRSLAQPYKNLRVVANFFIPSPEVCIHPWKIPAITVDGYAIPCCRIMDKNIYTFGNVLSDSFRGVWDSEKSQKMRESFLKKSPGFCKGCPRNVERNGCH